jgi:hypothetical protein
MDMVSDKADKHLNFAHLIPRYYSPNLKIMEPSIYFESEIALVGWANGHNV